MYKSIFLKLKLLLVSFCFFSITIHSQNFDTQLNLQDSTQTHIVILKNGKKEKGRILYIKNEKIFFEKKKKKENITLTLSEIQEIKVRGHLPWNKKKYARPFQYSQYLFYKNTGFSLQEGKKLSHFYGRFGALGSWFDRWYFNWIGLQFPITTTCKHEVLHP